MIGAIAGDIIGSVYEWDNYKSKDFQPLVRRDCFYTDDSICTIAVADALMSGRSPALSLKDWGRRYFDNNGWGGGFRKWLASESNAPYNSWGNGAAMRVSPAAWLANSLEEALEYSRRVTEVTHNHAEGLKGADATTTAVYLALHGSSPEEITQAIQSTYSYDLSKTVDLIRPGYRFNESCQGTVPQALICALTATSFEDAMRNAISIGGDSDTVAAIAGGVAEALFGVPQSMILEVARRLPTDMKRVLHSLYGRRGVYMPIVGVVDKSIYGRYRSPDCGSPGSLALPHKRLMRIHYRLVVLLATCLEARSWNGDLGGNDLTNFAYGFRVVYTFENGVLCAKRVSPGGCSGFDWTAQDSLCEAAELIEIALIENNMSKYIQQFGVKALRQGERFAEIANRRKVQVRMIASGEW